MNRLSIHTALISVVFVTLAACAGQPKHAPMEMRAGDPNSTNPDRIVCRQLPPPTGSHISQDKEVCHTYAEWQLLEKRSQEAIRAGQRQPGSAGGN